MAESASALIKRDEQLLAQQTTWRTGWQDIAQYVVPHKSNITVLREPGAEQTTMLFDSAAIHASTMLASSIHGTMTPSTQPWVSFRMRDDALNDNHEVEVWLEDCATRLHRALRQSNFTTSAHEMYLDLVGFGFGAKLIEEQSAPADGSFGGFRFTVPAVGTYRITEDKDGRADSVWRDIPLSRRNVVQEWGDKCGQEFLDKAKNRPDDIVQILHTVKPRWDRVYDKAGQPKAGSKNLAWASYYVLREGKKMLDEGGFEEFPYVVPRWSKTSGEVYGRGPSHTAIPDIKTLNAFKMFMMQSIPMAMQPPTVERDDAVIGDPDLTPGGRNIVNGSGPLTDNLAFMQTGYRPDIATEFVQQMRTEIQRIYHVDELQLADKKDMTATEAQIRYEFMQRLLGPTTGRLESEFLNPGTWRCFAIMARRNAFQILPDALQEATGQQSSAADLDVEYEGPLARAQRTIEITAQDRVVTFVSGISQILAPFAPDLARQVWDVLKLDKMIADRAEITGLASDELNDDQTIQQARQTRADQQAKQQQMDQLQKASEMAKNITPMMQGMAGGKPQQAAA